VIFSKEINEKGGGKKNKKQADMNHLIVYSHSK
jgi:hypothetical protein